MHTPPTRTRKPTLPSERPARPSPRSAALASSMPRRGGLTRLREAGGGVGAVCILYDFENGWSDTDELEIHAPDGIRFIA